MSEIFKSDFVDVVRKIDPLYIPQHLVSKPIFNVVTEGDVSPSEVVCWKQRKAGGHVWKLGKQFLWVNLDELWKTGSNVGEIVFES